MEDRVYPVSFSPDDKCLALGSSDKSIRVWDTNTGDLILGPLHGHSKSVTFLVFSPDGKRIVAGSDDGTIQIWDTSSGQRVSVPFEGHTRSIISVAYSHDRQYIVSGSKDGIIRVWDTDASKFDPDVDSTWTVADDGWVRGREQDLLLWVPYDLRSSLCPAPCKGVLNVDIGFSTAVAFAGATLGRNWQKCFSSQ